MRINNDTLQFLLYIVTNFRKSILFHYNGILAEL